MSNATPAKMNVLALVGMILALVGLVLSLIVGWFPGVGGYFGLFSLAGVILSHIGMKQISTRSETGRGFAITGIVTGYVGLLFAVIQIVIAIVVLVFVGAAVGAVTGVVEGIVQGSTTG
jgi:hypothetical protein